MTGITGNQKIDEILEFLAGDSEQDADKFKFQVGDILVAIAPANCPEGTIGVVRFRRNAYPEPYFQGYWSPIYYFVPLVGEGGGEYGEGFFRLATKEEKGERSQEVP